MAVRLALAAAGAPLAAAWWANGHMITAQVALDCGIMSAATIKSVQDITAEIASYYPESPEFLSSASWADDLKSSGEYLEAVWHYIDLPVVNASSPPPVAPPSGTDVAPDANVAWAIGELHSTAYSRKSTLLDKSRAVRFLTHFVGDIHQPLHAAAYFSAQFPTGDAGGNSWPVAGVPYTTELHAVWDSGVGLWVNDEPRPLTPAGFAYLANFSATVRAQFPATDPAIAALIKETDPMVWATESNAIAAGFVYTAPQAPTPIPDAYITQGQTIALKQIAVGGYRMAALFEYIFTSARTAAWADEARAQLRAAERARAGHPARLRGAA